MASRRAAFHDPPGLLADVLLDKLGNAVIDSWLASQGRLSQYIDVIKGFCYTGTRRIWPLDFRPAQFPRATVFRPVHVNALVSLASDVMRTRGKLQTSFVDADEEHSLREILRVGRSAGGARA